ncbi:hypothetical protein GCM10023228_34420 [Brevibacillus fulvus]
MVITITNCCFVTPLLVGKVVEFVDKPVDKNSGNTVVLVTPLYPHVDNFSGFAELVAPDHTAEKKTPFG